MSYTVRTRGVKELARDFGAICPDLKTEIKDELKQAGDIVKDSAVSRFSAVSPPAPRSVSGLKTRVRPAQSRVFVEQSRRRTTGRRGDWGAFQMRRILEPSLAEKSGAVARHIEGMVDRIANKHDL